jgi:hypothetical protein
MQLTVESVGPSKSGKALRVKAGGDWYGAKKDSGLSAGMTIEADVSDGEYGKWIDKWKAVNGSAQHTPDAGAKAPAAAGAAPMWGNFVSNQVAHAIQAGLITDPSQIKLWAAAAKQAYCEL